MFSSLNAMKIPFVQQINGLILVLRHEGVNGKDFLGKQLTAFTMPSLF